MAIQNLNPEEVDAAHAIVRSAELDLKARCQARGYENASVSGGDGRFFIMPHRYRDHKDTAFFARSYADAVARIEALPQGSWSPDLIEVTLGVPEAFGKVAA